MHYKMRYKVKHRFGLVRLKRRVKIYERARVDMGANQADKQNVWEVMQSLFHIDYRTKQYYVWETYLSGRKT